jgi:carboxymethylenebutenolidase
MSLSIETLRHGRNGERQGLLAYPRRAAPPLPAVLLIQEAWGIDDHIEDVLRRLALAGYAAFAPDLFFVGGARLPALERARAAEIKAFVDELPAGKAFDPAAREAALAARPEAEAQRLRASMEALTAALGASERNLESVAEATRFVREELAVTRGQKIVSVGFCMGGGLSARLAAADPLLAGAVVFYGTAPLAAEVERIRCPILAFYGGLDARINAGIAGFEAAMKARGMAFDHHVYPGAGHAFFNDTRPSYEVGAARDSYARLLAFLRDRTA